MDVQIKQMISFGDYIHLKERPTTGTRKYYRVGYSDQDVQRLARKLTLPKFDGGEKSEARALIENLDSYFHLNPMREAHAI